MTASFFQNLATELKTWGQGGPTLTPKNIETMCQRAAIATIGGMPTLRVYRQIEPDDLTPATLIEDDEGLQHMYLSPEEVATLRALLLSHDESAPPRLGEPLTMPTKLSDTHITTVVVEEMLGSEDEDDYEVEPIPGALRVKGAIEDEDELPGFLSVLTRTTYTAKEPNHEKRHRF